MLISRSDPISKAQHRFLVNGLQYGVCLDRYLKPVLDNLEFTISRTYGISTDDASSTDSVPGKSRSNNPASPIERPTASNYISSLMHVIQVALIVFMSSLGVTCHTKTWEAHKCDPAFGETHSTHIGKTQRRRKEGNARISNVSGIRPGLAKIIENASNSRYFDSTETDLHIAENACCIEYTDICSSNQDDELSKSKTVKCGH
jgi:hypothetical protein